MTTVREICRRIGAMEEDLGLFDREIRGVRAWPLVRMIVYYRIARQIDVFSTPHSERVQARGALEAVANTLRIPLTRPSRRRRQKDFLVFDHPRKVKVDGAFVDIYTQGLIDHLPPRRTEVFESWYFGRHLTAKDDRRTYLDDLAVGAALHSRLPLLLSRDEVSFVDALTRRIRGDFGVTLELGALLRREVRRHLYGLRYFTRLLESRRPKKIFLVVSYSQHKRALVCAAKRLGIPTIELQHGTFSQYHLGYGFEGVRAGVECFPDAFCSFGDYWNDLTRMPIARDRIVTCGFAHFHDRARAVASVERQPRTVLFISQGVIGRQLSRVALELADALPGHQIVYRLHPGEYDLWRAEYPELAAAARRHNVTVEDSGETGLYTRFAQSEYAVGVFSTAMYEGIALGCAAFVVDLPGAEYMDSLVEKGLVFKVAGAAEIAARIEAGERPAAPDRALFFAKPDWERALDL